MRDDLGHELELAKSILREHHAGVEPDPDFVARVKARLPSDRAMSEGAREQLPRAWREAAGLDPLRWAAARLLPAGLALALLLGVLVWRELPASGDAPASVDELAAWMVDPYTEGTP